MTSDQTPRTLTVIADDIIRSWGYDKINANAKPYLYAMAECTTMADTYGQDDARSIVLYFLNNATTWRGPDARRLKSELRAML